MSPRDEGLASAVHRVTQWVALHTSAPTTRSVNLKWNPNIQFKLSISFQKYAYVSAVRVCDIKVMDCGFSFLWAFILKYEIL